MPNWRGRGRSPKTGAAPAPADPWAGVKKILDAGDPQVDQLFAELDSLMGAEGDAAAKRRSEVTRELAALLVPDPPVEPAPSAPKRKTAPGVSRVPRAAPATGFDASSRIH